MTDSDLGRHPSKGSGDSGFGRILVAKHWITPMELGEATHYARNRNIHLETALLEMGLITEDLLLAALAELYHAPKATPADLLDIPQEVSSLIGPRNAVKYRAVPFRASNRGVDVALADVENLAQIDELAFILGKAVRVHVATRLRIHQALERYYSWECPVQIRDLLERLDRKGGPPRCLPPRIGRSSMRDEPSVDPSSRETGPPTSSKHGPPHQTRQERTLETLEFATSAGEIGYAVLAALGGEFLRTLLFQVRERAVKGWLGQAPGLRPGVLQAFSVGFDEPSIFVDLSGGEDYYLGRLPRVPVHEELARCWDGLPGDPCIVLPIRIADRNVAFAYGDRAGADLDRINLDFVRRTCILAAQALEKRIVSRKLHRR